MNEVFWAYRACVWQKSCNEKTMKRFTALKPIISLFKGELCEYFYWFCEHFYWLHRTGQRYWIFRVYNGEIYRIETKFVLCAIKIHNIYWILILFDNIVYFINTKCKKIIILAETKKSATKITFFKDSFSIEFILNPNHKKNNGGVD